MDLMGIYTIWLTIFSVSFTFLPIFVLIEWKKRGTADGFSSVNFVLPVLMMSCWFKHGILINDRVNLFINGINLVAFALYIFAFWFYQPKRKYLYGQLLALASTIFILFKYVSAKPEEDQADTMGAIAAGTQIASLAGGVYDLKRAFDLKTMEYVPAQIQLGLFALSLQWLVFGVLIGNAYMAVANFAGLILNIATLTFYVVYPPKTWRVPILGCGGEQKGKKD